MITRENYEEFFLSYVDNELPAETRLAVERFVAAHPDLREELETLQQCRLEPEPEAVFAGKNSLFQYEESLLLYIDGELDEADRNNVEELAFREPRVALELERLKMSVSQPETSIVFPGKESLYRPAKRRRVVMMSWLQAAAAAAVVAVVVLLLLPRGHKSDQPAGSVAVIKNNTDTVTPAVVSPLYSGKNALTTTASPANNTVAPLKNTRLPAPAVSKKTVLLVDTHPRKASDTHHVAASNDVATTDPAASSSKALTASHSASNLAASSDPATTSNASATSNQTTPDRTEKTTATLVAAVNIPRDQRSFATQALMHDAREESDGDMAGNRPPATGKTKLRGLFRRVTRAFGKTADRDDEGGRQVSISVFQVALK